MQESTFLFGADRGLGEIVPHMAFDVFKLHLCIAYLYFEMCALGSRSKAYGTLYMNSPLIQFL